MRRGPADLDPTGLVEPALGPRLVPSLSFGSPLGKCDECAGDGVGIRRELYGVAVLFRLIRHFAATRPEPLAAPADSILAGDEACVGRAGHDVTPLGALIVVPPELFEAATLFGADLANLSLR